MCSSAEQCQAGVCTAFYLDTDNDGFGQMTSATQRCGTTPPMGYVSATGDCCDQDPEARPGQMQFFGRERMGCGGYDYDCSGTPALERTTPGMPCATVQGDSCDRGCTTAGTQGWLTPLDDFIRNPNLTPADWDVNDFLPGARAPDAGGGVVAVGEEHTTTDV